MSVKTKLTCLLRAASLALVAGVFLNPADVLAQGCVIARGAPMCNIAHMHDMSMEESKFTATVAHRWFRSDRHFRGSEEERHRQFLGTEVVNDSHFIDAIASYNFTPQISASIVVPFVVHDRSSLYEHLGNPSGQRFHTQASGLADVRVGGLYWLFNPQETPKGNISFGAGMKLPTGDYRATDTFTRPVIGPEERRVDSSIQPGDGGWGAYIETQAYLHIWKGLSAYMQTSYLFNPANSTEMSINTQTSDFSVPDSYLSRGGLSYLVLPKYGVSLSIGGRVEGVPPEDAIGENKGFRRPGYSVAIEPGISVDYKKLSVGVTAPVAMIRNRQRSFGVATTGDAAFADYSINTTVTWRF